MVQNEFILGTCFQFIDQKEKYTIVFVTEDGIYCLCCREDGFKEIYGVGTLLSCLGHGELEIVSQNKIDVNISYKVINTF